MNCRILKTFALIAICTSLLFNACSSDNPTKPGIIEYVDTTSFTYPIGINSLWAYSTNFTVSNIRPDSINHYFSNYPISGSGTITILYDTVINFYPARCFHEIYRENSDTFSSRFYFFNCDTALICYGYRQDNFQSFNPYKVISNISYYFNGKTYSDPRNILLEYGEFNKVSANVKLSRILTDTLVLENPPVICLKYPVLRGTQWLFKYIPSGNYFVYKKYLNFENININNQNVSCVRTQRIHSGSGDFILYDFYSKFGQMKKDYTVKNTLVRNQQGFPIGFADFNYYYIVTSYSIND